MKLSEIWNTPGVFYALAYSLATVLVVSFQKSDAPAWKRALSQTAMALFLLGFMFIAVSIFFFVFSQRIHIRPTPGSGTVLGIICGVCYGLFASGGPTAALYLLPAINDKKEYLATIQAFLCVNNLVILTISLLLRRLNAGDLPMICAGTIAMIAGTFLGLYVHKKIPSELFGKVIYAFVGIGGLWIIISHLI